ncbi:MAG TPA: glyceraldehyde 3-phosphate dehydrogenase NAD-binding domain-containing protein, partial [Gemmatales bacterium]|nr:glyceraldehyde 3-phosphate dehydrogenase NAD-binding domain-containing protein [Gemmatales bacterium]
MPIRVGINGFGRIGRMVYRVMAEQPKDFQVIAVNDLSDPGHLAHLLKYDSVHGRFGHSVEVKDGNLIVAGQPVKVLSEREPGKLPWKDLGVDVVIESTGFFTEKHGGGKKGSTSGFADHV